MGSSRSTPSSVAFFDDPLEAVELDERRDQGDAHRRRGRFDGLITRNT